MISKQNKKLRILYVIPTMGGGGAEIMLGAIIEELHKLGHEILLVTMYPMDETYVNFPNKDYLDRYIPTLECSTRVLFSLRKKTQITDSHFQEIVEEFKPDVIHSHLFEADIIARSYFKKGVAYFSHGHDNMWQLTRLKNLKNLNKQAFTNLIERHWLMKQYHITKTAFIAISKDVESFFYQNLESDLINNVVMLHNGIDIKRFRNDLDRKIQIGEKIRIVSVGNLVPKKNHRFLIDIAVVLKEQNRDFSIDILGYGPLQEELENYARVNNISDFIHFRGNVKNVEDYLKKANVYVHPANYEPLGLVLIEAMASGLPVICLDGRGNRDLMLNGKNGYIFQEENSEQFVETIIELFDDQKKYLEISSFAKEFSSQFDIKNYVEKLVHLYESKCSTSNNSILKNAS
jgi:glycosyltransferase involved in cell wall biosynthesis